MLLAALGFLLAGSAVPLSEVLVPARYPPTASQELVLQLQRATTADQRAELDRALDEPGILLLQGRILYPRFYAAGEGETEKLGYRIMPHARLVFPMVGDANSLVILDLPESPEYFPHAADMVLLARQEPGHLQALAILVVGIDRTELYLVSEP